MKRKKILIFIDHEVIIRHFIANDTFKELELKNEVIYVFNEDIDRFEFRKNKIICNKIAKDKIKYTRITRERIGKWFLLYIVAVFRQYRIVSTNKSNKSHFRARVEFEIKRLGRRNVFLAKMGGLPIIYQVLKFIFSTYLGIHKDVDQLLKEEKPDLLIHPSLLNGYFINELFKASKKFNLKLIILMNSWDNCSTRAFCTGYPDKLVVWGEQTKMHAKQFLNMPEDKIECFGSAQFEIYKTLPNDTREELGKFFNVNPSKKILLYAGVSNSKNETKILKMLENAIKKSELPDCHVIYRPHPWRRDLMKGEENFFDISWNHISMDPTMIKFYKSCLTNPTKNIYLADYQISNKLLTLVDGVISPLSTMLIESLIKGKPVLAFFPDFNKNEPLVLNHIHYAEFIEFEETNSCFKEIDFIPSCRRLIRQIESDSYSKILKKKAEFFVSKKIETYGLQLEKLVSKMLH